MKLLYYLPAIGIKNLDKKHAILLHNLHYIYNNIKEKFSVSIGFYTVSEHIKRSINGLDFIENAYFYEKEGVLTELFLTNPNNDQIELYDYIIYALDDVKIVNMDIPRMIQIKEQYNIEILSPKILCSTHGFMRNNHNLTIQNFLEVYFLLMRPVDFRRFCSIHTIENKWMWGVDFLFGYYKIKAGVLNTCVANHELPSNSSSGLASSLMIQYLISRTKYTTLQQVSRDYKAIVETIDVGEKIPPPIKSRPIIPRLPRQIIPNYPIQSKPIIPNYPMQSKPHINPMLLNRNKSYVSRRFFPFRG